MQITFCFTDIAGSTELFRQRGEAAFTELLERHRVLIRAALASAGGMEIKTEGDGFFLAFEDPASAVRFALEAQQALRSESEPLEVRIGLHSGPAERRADGDFVALAVHRAARVVAAAHGGQVLLTGELADLAPAGCSSRPLGEYLLRDFDGPVALFQLVGQGLADGFPPPRAARTLHGLPIPRTSLVGRSAELAQLRRDVTQGQLLSLIGPGGVGKSRLCLEAMAQLAPSYPEGVHLVELSTAGDAAGVVSAALAAVKRVPRPDQDPLDALVFALQGSRLVLLDSCERSLDAVAPLVKELLDRCPGLALLATSTEPVRVPGERLLLIGPLGLPQADADGPDSEAVQLLHQRAIAGGASYVFEQALPDLAQIARRLDGIPLALELAAGRVAELGLPEVVLGLEDRFSLLTNGFRTALPRHRTLEGMVGWTVELLEEQERTVFHRICCLDGHWLLADLPGAVGLPPESVPSIRRLADRSLVALSEEDSRIRILDTVRLFGRREAGPEVRAEVRHSLTSFLADRLPSQAAERTVPERLAYLTPVMADVRRLMAEPPEGSTSALAAITECSYAWFEHRGLWHDALALLEGLVDRDPTTCFLAYASHAALKCADRERAESWATRALTAADGSPQRQAMACEVLDRLEVRLPDGSDPLVHATNVLAEDRRGPVALSVRGRWSHRLMVQGQPQASVDVLDELLALARDDQDVQLECSLLQGRATTLIVMGRLDESDADLRQVEALVERYDLHAMRGPCLATRTQLAIRRGDLLQALELADARLALARGDGHEEGELTPLSAIATLAAGLGDLARARRAGERHVELSQRARRGDALMAGRFNLAVIEAKDGRLDAAGTQARLAVELARTMDLPALQALALACAGAVLCLQGDAHGPVLAAAFERLASESEHLGSLLDPNDLAWLEAAAASQQGAVADARAAATTLDLDEALELAAAALA